MAKKKALLTTSDLSNPDKLDSKLIQAVVRELTQLEEVEKGLAIPTIRYVIDGTDSEILLKLRGKSDTDKAIISSSVEYQADIPWDKRQDAQHKRALILRPQKAAPPEFYIRLGEVYEAIIQTPKKPINGPNGWPGWLTALVFEITQCWDHFSKNREKPSPTWSVKELVNILKKAELPTDLLLCVALQSGDHRLLNLGWYYSHHLISNPISTGWPQYLKTHTESIKKMLVEGSATNRVNMLRRLQELEFDFDLIVEELTLVATGSGKGARERAASILAGHAEKARPLIEETLTGGKADSRNEAALLLWQICGEDSVAILKKHRKKESSERVKQTIDKILAVPLEQAKATEVSFEFPPVEIETGRAALPKEAKDGLKEHFDRAHEMAMQQYQREMERWNSPDRPQWMRKPTKPKAIKKDQLENLIAFVEGKGSLSRVDRDCPGWYNPSFGTWLKPPEIKLIHVVRLAMAFDQLSFERSHRENSMYWYQTRSLDLYRSRCEEPFGLRELAVVLSSLTKGKDRAQTLGHHWLECAGSRWSSFCDWEDDAIWPFFAENLEILESVLSITSSSWYHKRQAAFRALAMFPQLPPQFVPVLWNIALGEAKTDRPLAQEALKTVPNKTPQVLVGLSDGKQAVRAAAAEWLGKLGDQSAIDPLKKAFKKEKQEIVKGRMMLALEELGADVNEFLDRKKLLAEAKEGLKKKLPSGMEWVPLDLLPKLHWSDTKKQVDPQIVRWWVVQSIKQKTAVCSPLTRRFLQMCPESETQELARWIMQTWIDYDTRTIPHEEASERAKRDAKTQWSLYKNYDWFKQAHGSEEGLYRVYLNNYLSQYLGSASGEKGMLALACVSGGRECVRMAERYIRKHYGQRMAQSKALIEVLAWINHPLAIQVLLSIANRFRTKALQKAAREHVNAMAEREGWTLDQLADRTIPDCGFARATNEQGEPVGTEAKMILDYGGRGFTVTLNDDLQPVITNEEGKTLKNPPAAGKSDDAEQVKEAKKQYSEGKKIVKEVVKQQSLRMYEALCTQRAWPVEEWQRYLAEHPVMGRLCTRLVWSVFEDDKLVGCFRPLEDGSLTNEEDDEVTLNSGSTVRLAHTCNVPKKVGEAWSQHLQDYDVAPLFEQFGRETFELPKGQEEETQLNDFEGHMVRTFQIRSKANKLGYVRGEAYDGGGFSTYHKSFPSLSIKATIHFTGSYVPEEDMSAALISLTFSQLKKEETSEWDEILIPLGKVPPVLLSECYNDIKQIAEMGTGFDEKWQEKSWQY